MNRIHRIVFNHARDTYQVASEHARGSDRRKAAAGAGLCALALAVLPAAQAQSVVIDNGGHEIVDGSDPAGGGAGTQPSPWEISGNLAIGHSGTSGELLIRNAGKVSNMQGTVGNLASAVGEVTVIGEGASWHNASRLYLGNVGQGTLAILDGASVSAGDSITMGTNSAGAVGVAQVSGVGSSLAATGNIALGHIGTGTLTVEDGGLVTASHVYMGGLPVTGYGGIGHLTLAGSDGRRGALAMGFLEVGAGDGNINFDGGILRATGDEADFLRNVRSGDVAIGAGGAFIDSNGHNIGIGADLQGSGGLTKSGEGILTLSGQNDYAGATTIEAGILRVGTNEAWVSDGVYVINGGTLDLTDANYALGRAMSSLSGGGGTLDMGDAFVDVGQSANTVFDGNITGSSGRLIKDGAGKLTLNGQISGLSGVYAEGGTLALNGVNIYLGETYINDAAVEVGHDKALSSSQIIVGGSSDNGVLRAGGDLALANRVQLMRKLTIDGSHHLTLSGDIAGGFLGGITKTGAGTLTLSGANTYLGATTVEAGALIVDGTIAPSSQVAVKSGATLGGSGTVSNATVEDGGILAPGSNAIGALTVHGNLALSSGAILDYELGAPATVDNPAAGRSDRLVVTGDLRLDGTLNLAQGASPSDGAARLGYYRLMTYGGELTDNGLEVGAVPYGVPGLYEIEAGGGKVDLFVSASLGDDTLQHWQGGDGHWNSTDTRWLNQGGDLPVAWAGNHAAFKNEPGGVNGGVIDVVGAQRFAGLQFVDEGFRLQGVGTLETAAGGSEIRVLAERAEIAAGITGAGGITKTEAGTLILSGANSYAGGTTISGGVLSVSNDANLGHEDGALAFNGGVLQVTGTDFNDTARDIAWGSRGGGFDIVEAANDFYLDRNLVGQGDLVKRGAGALWLAGANAYGNTRVEEGSVLGDANSLSGNISNAGTVTFIQADDARFAGDITGLGGANGGMVKDGAGVLALDGRSTLDWTVAEGGLQTAAARFSGNVLLDGAGTALTFADAANAVYGGRISGNGRLTLAGDGILLLTGDSAAFAGTTTLASGALLVGKGEGGGALGGSLAVRSGATLGGSGTVGAGAGSQVAIASGGTLAPGNSIGTLTVDGDLTFEAGSIYAVEVNPFGADSDRINVTGKATLNGGSVAHIGADGAYGLRSTYTILSAAALEGSFDEVVSDFAFLTPRLMYDYGAGAIGLELARNERRFASAALTRNQSATAGGIDSMGLDAAHPVYDAIVRSADQPDRIRAGFDALSGEIHASAKSALIEDSRFIRNAANDRLRAAFGKAGASAGPVLAYGSGSAPTQVPADYAGPVFWSHGFGAWSETDGNGNAAGLDRSTGGLLIAADRPAGDWRIGVLGGYSHASLGADARRSSAKIDNYHLGLYGGTQWGDIAFRTGAAYSWHKLDTARSVAIPGIDERLTGDYEAGTFQVFGELAYGLQVGKTRVEPFANLAHVSLHTGRVTETGGAAALMGNSGNTDVTFSTLGMRAAHHLALGSLDVTLAGMAGWRHAFGNRTPTSKHAFSAGEAFSIAGAPIARDSAVVEAGLSLSLASDATFGLAYTGQLSGQGRDHGLKANVAIRF
ncbi:autotransporter domain-containing protein [Pollutimonas bauzanensis]|uniref:Outer membrane autotransporter barrel domain-containing protein n=1 Tax=Pollutimonas bauzanensis TaxID=658167 RepID=A0A1M5Z2S3_9BURK|nr:autotransporter domain-containing protein [Pollutimonas bauzanensis]SHI18547.1 outer membrane autotransporter barrel domain-containing protein [Pollutimonas bauzanensis]